MNIKLPVNVTVYAGGRKWRGEIPAGFCPKRFLPKAKKPRKKKVKKV